MSWMVANYILLNYANIEHDIDDIKLRHLKTMQDPIHVDEDAPKKDLPMI